MRFTDHLWKQVQPLYHKILQQPFIRELAEGTLSKEIFKHYMAQDSLYLQDYARALSMLSAKSVKTENILLFARFARDAILVERSLHDSYFKQFHIQPQDQPSPACFMYTHYLLSVSSLENIETGIAALLPCFWVYRKVGLHVLSLTEKNNPYFEWIQAYSGEEFSASVDHMLQITEETAADASPGCRKEMEKAFIMSTKLEYVFWDSAYKMEQWKV